MSSSYLLLKKDVISLEVEIHSRHNARHGSGPTFGLDSHQKARAVWGIEAYPGIGGRGGGRRESEMRIPWGGRPPRGFCRRSPGHRVLFAEN